MQYFVDQSNLVNEEKDIRIYNLNLKFILNAQDFFIQNFNLQQLNFN